MTDGTGDYVRRLEAEARDRQRQHDADIRTLKALHSAEIEQRERAASFKRGERRAAAGIFALCCLFSAWPALGPALDSRRPVSTFAEYFVAEAVFWLGLYFSIGGGIMTTKAMKYRDIGARSAIASGWLAGLTIMALLVWFSTLDPGVMRAADHLRTIRDGLSY